MSPAFFLALLCIVTAGGLWLSRLRRRRDKLLLRRLAGQWQMHYVEHDLFHLGQRVAEAFPVPGAADLVIRHVIYALQQDQYRYIFTAEYTVGGAGAQQRLWRAGMVCERDQAGRSACSPVMLASGNLPLEQQYQELRKVPSPPAFVPPCLDASVPANH